MSIPYTTNIPVATNTPAQDVGNMTQNTNSISQIWDVDHFTFSSSSPAAGTHSQVTMSPQAPYAVSSDQGVLICTGSGSNVWPVWQNAQGATQMMSSISNNTGTGYTSLNGGCIIQWGNVIGVAANPTGTPITFQFPYTTGVNTIQLTGNSTSTWFIFSGISKTGFTIKTATGASSGSQVFWMAIGI